jgi:uroporphyrinogen-III synthase
MGHPPLTDWIFFSSPSGVALFAKSYTLPENVKLAALGNGTAQAVKENLSLSPAYTSASSIPEEAMADFASQVLPNETVLIPRSEQSLKKMAGILSAAVLVDWPFYRTLLSPPAEVTTASYLIFTSPSNASSYFSRYKLNDEQICVAIGSSTAEQLRDIGIQKILESKTPTEEGLWEVISNYIKIT